MRVRVSRRRQSNHGNDGVAHFGGIWVLLHNFLHLFSDIFRRISDMIVKGYFGNSD